MRRTIFQVIFRHISITVRTNVVILLYNRLKKKLTVCMEETLFRFLDSCPSLNVRPTIDWFLCIVVDRSEADRSFVVGIWLCPTWKYCKKNSKALQQSEQSVHSTLSVRPPKVELSLPILFWSWKWPNFSVLFK